MSPTESPIPKTPEQARAWLKSLALFRFAALEEPQRTHMLTLFAMMKSDSSSNNQRSFTEVYTHAGKTYHVTTFEDGEIVVEEELTDDL
jgi:hypothetical protein